MNIEKKDAVGSLPCFIINLKKDNDRMEMMDSQMRKLGINYERVEAVYGAELTDLEFQKNCSLLGYLLAPKSTMHLA